MVNYSSRHRLVFLSPCFSLPLFLSSLDLKKLANLFLHKMKTVKKTAFYGKNADNLRFSVQNVLRNSELVNLYRKLDLTIFSAYPYCAGPAHFNSLPFSRMMVSTLNVGIDEKALQQLLLQLLNRLVFALPGMN